MSEVSTAVHRRFADLYAISLDIYVFSYAAVGWGVLLRVSKLAAVFPDGECTYPSESSITLRVATKNAEPFLTRGISKGRTASIGTVTINRLREIIANHNKELVTL